MVIPEMVSKFVWKIADVRSPLINLSNMMNLLRKLREFRIKYFNISSETGSKSCH